MSQPKVRKLKVIPNPDKKSHESWDSPEDRRPLNFPHPYRCLITGLPGAGKTMSVLNILVGAQPVFSNIFIIHPEIFDTNASEEDERINNNILITECKIGEYSGVEFTAGLRYIPSPTFFDNISKKKNLLIIDDCELKNYVKGKPYRSSRINKLFSYTSTHRSLSIIITAQDPWSQLLPCIYRFCNVFILYKFRDKNQISLLSRNIGIPKEKLDNLFKLCKNNHDSITLDNTIDSPYPYRYNILNPVEFEDEDEE